MRWRDSRLYDEGWRQWCEAAGLPRWRKPAAIHAYEEEHYALQAAIAGQGLVLASSVMVSDSVRLGALAPLRPEVRVPGAAYTALCAPGANGIRRCAPSWTGWRANSRPEPGARAAIMSGIAYAPLAIRAAPATGERGP